MAARTRSAKLAAKRGRPLKEAIYREPNGRASRAAEPADKVALEARARNMNLTLTQAKDQRAASFIGYLAILGPVDGISERQYEAATDFLALRNDWLMSKKIPGAEYDNEGKGGGGDYVSDAYIDWCQSVHDDYTDCRKAINAAQAENRGANLWGALDICVVQGAFAHELIGDVRLLCNVLAKFFKR